MRVDALAPALPFCKGTATVKPPAPVIEKVVVLVSARPSWAPVPVISEGVAVPTLTVPAVILYSKFHCGAADVPPPVPVRVPPLSVSCEPM